MDKQSKFKISFKVNSKQIIAIIIITIIFVLIPFVISYISNPDKKNINEIVKQTIESFKIKSYETDSPFIVTIPIINKRVNLTIIKQNPQLVIYGGLFLFTISIIIGISLITNISKGD
jgi:hypothetical protein